MFPELTGVVSDSARNAASTGLCVNGEGVSLKVRVNLVHI